MEIHTMKKTTYAGYIRVSSEEQKKSGLSPEYQEQKIIDYIQLKEGTLFKMYIDLGKSGGKTENRPSFNQMMIDSKNKKFNNIIFLKLDRFSRNARDIILSFDELNKYGISIISIHENIDTTTAMGEAVMQIIGIFAGLERSMAKERTEDIHIMKVEEGYPVTQPPAGYRWKYPKGTKNKRIQNTWVIDTQASKQIITIFKRLSEGEKTSAIANELKIPRRNIYNTIKNNAYLGYIQYKGKTYKGVHEPIISNDLWRKVHGCLPDCCVESTQESLNSPVQ